jgi:hypothetical protein
MAPKIWQAINLLEKEEKFYWRNFKDAPNNHHFKMKFFPIFGIAFCTEVKWMCGCVDLIEGNPGSEEEEMRRGGNSGKPKERGICAMVCRTSQPAAGLMGKFGG